MAYERRKARAIAFRLQPEHFAELERRAAADTADGYDPPSPSQAARAIVIRAIERKEGK